MSTEVLFLADTAKPVVAIKPLENDLLYIKHHWHNSFKLCAGNEFLHFAQSAFGFSHEHWVVTALLWLFLIVSVQIWDYFEML